MSDDDLRMLASLTDGDAERTLNIVLKGVTIRQPELAGALGDAEGLSAIFADDRLSKLSGEQNARAIRAVLVQMLDSADLAPRVVAAMKSGRNSLIEPITTALVLAGIVLLLQTEGSVEVASEGGKTSFKVKVEKKATSDTILGKFFSLFTRGS